MRAWGGAGNIFTIFSRAHAHIFLELFVEIIHIFVAHLLCDFVDLEAVFRKKLLGMLNAAVVNVGVKAFTNGLIENLSKVGAVIPEKRGDALQFDIILIIMIYVIENIVEHGIPGRVPRGIHNHLTLLGY